jgi:micrococcal nuclease
MSRPWNPKVYTGRRSGARRLRFGGRLPFGRGSAFRPPSLAEIRLTLLGGIALGLVISFAIPSGTSVELAPSATPTAPPDPYAEARRSKAILAAQEGAPAPVSFGSSAVVTVSATAAIRVIDGDTFDLGGERIRIADIDTPEMKGRCGYETALARRAKTRLRSLLGEGAFELRPVPGGKKRDRYGRSLRIVTRDQRSIGDQLVAEGLARTWSGRRQPWC